MKNLLLLALFLITFLEQPIFGKTKKQYPSGSPQNDYLVISKDEYLTFKVFLEENLPNIETVQNTSEWQRAIIITLARVNNENLQGGSQRALRCCFKMTIYLSLLEDPEEKNRMAYMIRYVELMQATNLRKLRVAVSDGKSKLLLKIPSKVEEPPKESLDKKLKNPTRPTPQRAPTNKAPSPPQKHDYLNETWAYA